MSNTKAVWKYVLQPECTLKMPKGAKCLTVQMQSGQPMLWVLVDPKAPLEDRKFLVLGTGHEGEVTHRGYVGTWQSGSYVWHLFEV